MQMCSKRKHVLTICKQKVHHFPLFIESKEDTQLVSNTTISQHSITVMAWSGHFDDFASVQPLPPLKNQSHRRFDSMPNSGPSTNSGSSRIVKIESLCSGNFNGIVAGIILAKEAPKSVLSRKNPGSERHLLSFVIRDSPTFYIQTTCWGTETYIQELSNSFHVGDIVQIQNALVQEKVKDGYDKFRPFTTSPYMLSVSENHCNVSLHNGPDQDSYRELLHLPTKPNNDFYTLEDILVNGQNLDGDHINILAAVRNIGAAKDITTKTGKQTRRCELKLFDETCQSFPLILWDSEIIDMSQSWMPFDTVIFAADVRVNYDNFRNGMVATAISKTIFTVNPNTLEAHSLYQYAQSQALLGMDGDSDSMKKGDPDLASIKDVFSVNEIVCGQTEMKNSWEPMYGIVYGFLTQFDADTETHRTYWVSYQCSKCRQRVSEDKGFLCGNAECAQGVLNMFDTTGQTNNTQPTADFSISLSISDHSGTITQCHMSGNAVEKLVGCKPDDFLKMSPTQKTQIKWKYLLERCKIFFKLTKNSNRTSGTSVRVLHCELASPPEVCQNLKD
ncbi:hypothetical protein ScPMuIL_004783 [Solemya velum]